MARRCEFSRTVRAEIIKRAMHNGIPKCEHVYSNGARCGSIKGLEVNHKAMDAMRSDDDKRKRKLTADDGELLCSAHHREETKRQQADLAKARAQEAAHIGAKPPPAKPMVSRGFAKVSREKPPLRVANGVRAIARRYGQS